MADLSGEFAAGISDPSSIFPPEGSFNIGGIPSAYGAGLNFQRAEAAKQLMKAQQDRLPFANELAIGRMKGEISRLPEQDRFQREKLVQEYSELKGKPAGKLIDKFADMWPYMREKDPVSKARIYGTVVQEWQAQHPGVELPPELTNYNPDVTDQHIESAYNMKRFSVENEQQMEKAILQRSTALAQTQITAEANIKAQRGRGVEAAALRQAEDKKNTKRIGELKKSLADPKLTDEAKEQLAKELESLAMPKFEEDQTKRFPETARVYMTPEMQSSFDKRAKEARNAYLDAHGLRIKMFKDGKAYMIPRSQYSAALKEGYTKEGK